MNVGFLAIGLGLVTACSSGASVCEVNADCAAGMTCSPAHTCEVTGSATAPDAGGDPLPACVPNHDGVIERDEVVILVPTSVTFRLSGETPIDLRGSVAADGTRHWNFTGTLAGDHDVTVSTAPLAGAWFAGTFPGGSFISPLTSENATDLLAVFAANAEKVQILGAASKMSGPSQTELTYDPPVDALALPLHVGKRWAGTSTVTGTASGVYSIYTDAWTQDVDARGVVETPYGSFPVLRIRLVLKRTIGLYPTTTTTYAFVAECFGTVATVTSKTNESAAEFTTAASVQRMAL